MSKPKIDWSKNPHSKLDQDVSWLKAENSALRAEVERLLVRVAELSPASAPRPLKYWHEDIGTVLWWRFPVDEPPYVGSPCDDDWPGYHTHWTPIIVPDLRGGDK